MGRVGEQGMECNAGTVGNAAGQVLRSKGGSSKQARRGWAEQDGKARQVTAGWQGDAGQDK